MKKVGVLIHGYHLYSNNWKDVVWGMPGEDLMGRVPRGILVALEEKAELVIFPSGGSRSADGMTEAELTLIFTMEHFMELNEFSAFEGIDLESARERIRAISQIETKSQCTAEEIGFAGKMFRDKGIKNIVLVTSPDHASRSFRDAFAVFQGDESLVHFTKGLFVTSSQVPYSGCLVKDVIIQEPRPKRRITP